MQLALARHSVQTYGPHPFVVHLVEVYSLVHEAAPNDEDALAAAWLHDVLEDTHTGYRELEVAFDKDFADLVQELTDEEGPNRKERKKKTYARMWAAGSDKAMLVKLADRLANVRRCVKDGHDGLLEMYRREYSDFRTAVYRLNQPKAWWTELHETLAPTPNGQS